MHEQVFIFIKERGFSFFFVLSCCEIFAGLYKVRNFNKVFWIGELSKNYSFICGMVGFFLIGFALCFGQYEKSGILRNIERNKDIIDSQY